MHVSIFPHYVECQHGLAMRKVSVCRFVHLSVFLSVKCVDCHKMEERSVQSFIAYERSFSLVF